MGKVLLFSLIAYFVLFVSLVYGETFIARWDFPKENEVMIHGFKVYDEKDKEVAVISDPTKRQEILTYDLKPGDNKFYMRTYYTYEGDVRKTEYSNKSEFVTISALPAVSKFSLTRLIDDPKETFKK